MRLDIKQRREQLVTDTTFKVSLCRLVLDQLTQGSEGSITNVTYQHFIYIEMINCF